MADIASLFRLDGKTAIIAGAARGIGATAAAALARAGAHMVLTDILEHAGHATKDAIIAEGGRTLFLQHDVTDEVQWTKVVDDAIRQTGGLDVLVNNAGIETAASLTRAWPAPHLTGHTLRQHRASCMVQA